VNSVNNYYKLLNLLKYRHPENKFSGDNKNARFYGPARSCKDLEKLGYSLNGYYLVQNENTELKNSEEQKIEVIICRFQLPSERDGRLLLI